MSVFSGGPQAAQKRYYEKNKEEILARKREYVRAYQREWIKRPEVRAKQFARTAQWARDKKERLAGRPKPDTCELCGQPSKKICWDHNHDTGKFRGWLCTPCNFILGRVKDDPVLLRRMANYLEQHK